MAFMSNDRVRAADAIVVNEEDLRSMSRRAAVAALATWSAESMGYDEAGRAGYVEAVMSSFLRGADAEAVLRKVRSDLERAGKPALSTTADHVLAQAEADAVMHLHGRGGQQDGRSRAVEGILPPPWGQSYKGWPL